MLPIQAPIDPKAIVKIPKKQLGDTSKMTVGTMVTGRAGERVVRGKVTEIGKTDVTIDLNHPLAGKTLQFQIEVVGVIK